MLAHLGTWLTLVAEGVPTSFRVAAICTLFFSLWAVNLRVLDALDLPFRAALGLKKGEGDAADLFRAARHLWLLLGAVFMLFLWASGNGWPRLASVSLVLFWPAAPLLLLVTCRKVFVEIKWLVTDFIGAMVFFREVRAPRHQWDRHAHPYGRSGFRTCCSATR